MPEPEDETGYVTWYRIEKVSVVLSTLAATRGEFITCAKALRRQRANGTVSVSYSEEAWKSLGERQREQLKQATPKMPAILSKEFHDARPSVKLPKEGLLHLESAKHLVASTGSDFMSGAISIEDGRNLFTSGYFYGQDGRDNVINKIRDSRRRLVPRTMLLRVRVPISRLVYFGGDTVATNIGDVASQGALERPGFMPTAWVDHVQWITGDQVVLDANSNDARLRNLRQIPNAGSRFAEDPNALASIAALLGNVRWIQRLGVIPKQGEGFGLAGSCIGLSTIYEPGARFAPSVLQFESRDGGLAAAEPTFSLTLKDRLARVVGLRGLIAPGPSSQIDATPTAAHAGSRATTGGERTAFSRLKGLPAPPSRLIDEEGDGRLVESRIAAGRHSGPVSPASSLVSASISPSSEIE